VIHVICLYLVDPQNAHTFISFLRDGLWCESVPQLYPGLIGTDLLRNSARPDIFLSIEFWTSEEAYRTARYSPATSALASLLKNLGVTRVDLGAFSFPPRDNTKDIEIRRA
jgi:quinol monooxygenase YgiN